MQNSAVLNGIVLLLPLHMQRQGKEKFCSPIFFPAFFLSPHLSKL